MKIEVNKDKVKIKNADFVNSHFDVPSSNSHWLSDFERSHWLQKLMNQKQRVNLPKSIKIHIFVLVQLLENHSHITWLNIM